MSRVCQISKKRRQVGNNVSHANNKRKKVWNINLHRKTLYDSETGQTVRVRVSSRMLRTIDKHGLSAALRKHGMTIADLQ